MSESHPVRDLLPAYALGILDDEEKTGVREHVAECASCRAELASFREVTGRLAAAASPAEPPASLEGRILRAVRASPASGGRAVPGVRPPRRPAAWTGGVSWRALTGVAAALAVVLGAANLLQWTGVISPTARGASPRLTTAILSGVGDARGAYGTIVLDPLDNEGVLAVTGLPGLDTRHQYQLWLIRDGDRRSAGIFSADAEGYGSMLLKVPQDFKDFRSFGVSVEPWGGSPAPTGTRVLAGRL
jgi:anti-sigma-K factor RskA